MRQSGISVVCLLFIFSTVMAYAAPVGNVAMPRTLKRGVAIKEEGSPFAVIIQPEVDVVFDRNLKDQKGDTEYKFFGGKAGIVLDDDAVLYGIFGAADAEWKLKVLNDEVRWETDSDLVWGAGASIVLYAKEIILIEKGLFTIGVDGRYRKSELDIDKVTLNDISYTPSDAVVTNPNLDFDEWQVAVEFTYQTGGFVPYGGIKYSDIEGDAEVTISGTKYTKDLGADEKIGIFAGCDILISESMSAYIEGRFLDEQALSAGATIRF